MNDFQSTLPLEKILLLGGSGNNAINPTAEFSGKIKVIEVKIEHKKNYMAPLFKRIAFIFENKSEHLKFNIDEENRHLFSELEIDANNYQSNTSLNYTKGLFSFATLNNSSEEMIEDLLFTFYADFLIEDYDFASNPINSKNLLPKFIEFKTFVYSMVNPLNEKENIKDIIERSQEFNGKTLFLNQNEKITMKDFFKILGNNNIKNEDLNDLQLKAPALGGTPKSIYFYFRAVPVIYFPIFWLDTTIDKSYVQKIEYPNITPMFLGWKDNIDNKIKAFKIEVTTQ